MKRNDGLYNMLKSDFVSSRNPAYGWTNIIGSFMYLPRLHALWPIGLRNEAGTTLTDLSTNGRSLTVATSTPLDVDVFIPYAGMDGTNNYYLFRTDASGGLDFNTTSSFTFIGWVMQDVAQSGARYVMAKATNLAATSQYALYLSGGQFTFEVYDSVTTLFSVTSTVTIEYGKWNFVACRFEASNNFSLYVNGTMTNGSSIPTSLANTAASFTLGQRGDLSSSTRLDGKIAICSFTLGACPESVLFTLYQSTKPAFAR